MSEPLAFKPGTIVWVSSGDGQLLFEVLVADEGRHLTVQSGFLSRDQIIEQSRDEELTSGLPGRTLMAVARGAVTQEVRQMMLRQRAGQVPWEIELAMKERIIRPAEKGELVIAGVEAPMHANSRYVRLDPGLMRQWMLDPVANRAVPAFKSSAKLYVALRAFTPDEWSHVERNDGRLLPIQSQPQAVKSRAKLEAWHDTWSVAHPKSSDREAHRSAQNAYPDMVIPRSWIEALRKPRDGSTRRRGRKPGKGIADLLR